jgi:hypothetical protein
MGQAPIRICEMCDKPVDHNDRRGKWCNSCSELVANNLMYAREQMNPASRELFDAMVEKELHLRRIEDMLND